MTHVNIEKMLEARMATLQLMQSSNEAVSTMLEGVELVVDAGPEALHFVAEQAGGAEMILATLSSLVDVIRAQQTEAAMITESWLQCEDSLITIKQIMDEAASKRTE